MTRSTGTRTGDGPGAGVREDPADDLDRAPNRSAERAYRRREKREQRLTHDRLSRTGRPVRSALARVPFVIALIVVLGGGISGVLYLNTASDESGLHAEQVQQTIADQKLQIEALSRSIAELDATPRIAQQAQALGMVPAGDAAILQIPTSGTPSLIGTPSVVPTPRSAKAAGSAPTTTAARPTTVPATTPPRTAGQTTAAQTAAAKTTAQTAPATTTAASHAAPPANAPKSSAHSTTAAASTTVATTHTTTSGGHR